MSSPSPSPETAQASFRRTDYGSIAVLTWEVPGRRMNVVDPAVLSELATDVDAALADPAISGVVLTSGKPGSFGGGADLDALPGWAADPATAGFLQRTHELMVRMADAAKPIVAAIDGYALGGAFELALACHTIVVTDRARVGLPEATLGLIPGGGGTQLLLARTAPATAIELMVTGRVLPAAAAVAAGLADVVTTPDTLLATALERARGGAGSRAAQLGSAADAAAAVSDVVTAAAAVRRPLSEGARQALVEVVTTGLRDGRAAGLAAEREQFTRRLNAEDTAALIHLFHLESESKRRLRTPEPAPSRIGVVGAGQMGAGIAATAVSHGVTATVRDIDQARLDQARDRAAAATAKAGTTSAGDWHGTTGWAGFGDADVVVEAVFELPELKRETLALVEAQVGPRTVITTNTSAIPVGSLADSVRNPHRFLGTHFFSPVEQMPLVELVPHASTEPDAVARGAALARALGKTPVVVADYPGFFTSRVYARWLIEGLRLLQDGADPVQIEQEAREIGFPIGPLQACDEVTLELVRQASVTQVAERVLTDRVDVAAAKQVLGRLIDAGIEGKRFGRGFYCYVDGRRSGFDPVVAELAAATGSGVATGVPGERLLLAFVTESLLCWDDATLCHPDDGDLASVLGIGFPRPLGGPFHWADRQGAAVLLERCRAQDAHAFPVGESLKRLAAAGGRYADEPRLERPGRG